MSIGIDFTKIYTERDYQEEASMENGNYENRCIECGNLFIGYKRRVLCKICQEEIDRKNEHFITDGNS